jgi:hypothetical protein
MLRCARRCSGGNALVCNALVSGNAWVFGNAQVRGNARVLG